MAHFFYFNKDPSRSNAFPNPYAALSIKFDDRLKIMTQLYKL
ncbi:hypothetical protein WNY78_08340 [Psychroserpens sp. AS72]